MVEERQYIPISQLNDATSVDKNTDVLIISQKQDFDDQEYVSKKITAADFMLNVDMPPAEKTKIGGFKIYDRIEDQEGEQKFVDLNEHNQAFVKVPTADNNTIIEANGKISVSPTLKDLADDADNIVKKNVTNVSVEVKDGQYIAGFEQKNGKIQNVQYRELSGIGGLSVDNTWSNPKTTSVPSTALVDDRFNTLQAKDIKNLADVAKTGRYDDLIGKPTIVNFQFPIGAIYISAIHLDPKDTAKWPFDYGEWLRVGEGKCLFGANDAEYNVGQQIEAGLPNITGETSEQNTSSDEPLTNVDTVFNSGALYLKNKTSDYGGSSTSRGAGYYRIGFDASKSNSIYGKSTTVQPPALVVEFWKRVS